MSAMSQLRAPQEANHVEIGPQGQRIGQPIPMRYWSNGHGGDLVSVDERFHRPSRRSHGLGRVVGEQVVEGFPANAVDMQLEVSTPSAAAFDRTLGSRPMRKQPLLR